MNRRVFTVISAIALALMVGAPASGSSGLEWRAELGIDQTQFGENVSEEIVGRSAWPGPDGALYAGSLCTYQWIDITGTGTPTDPLGDDTVEGPYPIGFDFEFYGAIYTDFYVSSNGYLEFGDNYSSLSNQCPLPNSSLPNNIIAIMWDDLDPGDTGDQVFYQTFGPGACPWGGYPGACLVVLYDDFCHYPGGGTCTPAGTWQAIIFDDASIVMQYLDPGTEFGLSATSGIEGADAALDYGLYYNCNAVDPTLLNACHRYAQLVAPVLSNSTKSVSPGAVVAGGVATYTIDIVNNGNADATATTFVDPIPMGTVFAGGLFCSSGTCSYNSGTDEITWSGSLAPGTSALVNFDVSPVPGAAPCGGSVLNTGVIDDPDIPDPVIVEAAFDVWDDVPLFTDLEADDGGFVPGQGEWEWGIPTYPPDLVAQGAHSGVNVWGVNLDDDADDTIGQHILSIELDVPFTLPGYPVTLQWWDWYGDEAADYRQIWINGSLEFEFPTGQQRFWAFQQWDLTPYAGQTITLEFILEVCCADPGPDGWYIDDIGVAVCLPPEGLYLDPDLIPAIGCNGQPQLHSFMLANATGAAGTFTMTYDPITMNAVVVGPPDVTLENLESAMIDVELTPDACLGTGESVVVEVTADGNGYSDTSIIDKTIGAAGGWTPIAIEPNNGRMDNVVGEYNGLIWSITGYGDNTDVRTYDVASDSWTIVGTQPPFGVNYARSGCFAGNMVYMYADSTTTGFDFNGLWSYNMDTGVWTNEAPGGTPPAEPGIWAPSWVYNPTDGYCYMTGGSTLPGGGNLTTVYVYDPVSNSWMAPLPNFAGPRDFHSAWVFNRPSDGHDLLCVAGGVDAASVAYSDTECYDFTLAAWNPPNADLGPLPGGLDWWGMGYANLNGDQLWMISGIIAGGAVSDQAWYYDTNVGGWIDGGPIATGGYYRTAATTLLGEVYKIGGSTGGFAYSGLADRNQLGVCPLCADVAITKDNGVDSVVPGTAVTYTITAANIGPEDAPGTSVIDIFPAALLNVNWTCVATGGATCTPAGSGDLMDVADIPIGDTVTYTVVGDVDPAAAGTLDNMAEVVLGPGLVDLDPGNNVAMDSDTLAPTVDLAVTKDDGVTYVLPGDPNTYMITVTNPGPSSAVAAVVEDIFPADFTGVTWTCVGSGGGICTPNGAGDIMDTVTVPPGGMLEYMATGTVDPGAMGPLVNTATVAPASGVTDTDPGNNSATDSNAVGLDIFADGFESGDTSAWSVTVP
jgi:uncharacterized repeat protein (TIGR01451 family)